MIPTVAKARDVVSDAILLAIGGVVYSTEQHTEGEVWTSDGAFQPPVRALIARAREALGHVAALGTFYGLTVGGDHR